MRPEGLADNKEIGKGWNNIVTHIQYCVLLYECVNMQV